MENIYFIMQIGCNMTQDYQLETILAHAGINSDEATGALASPIHFSTTYQHPEFGQSTGFDYTRTKNPTRATVEKTLAAIEKADYAIATSSGMSAIVSPLKFSLQVARLSLPVTFMEVLSVGSTIKKKKDVSSLNTPIQKMR